MIPILYDSETISFVRNGIGILTDAISCIVDEERNGPYELTMRYPLTGIHYDDIELRSIIYAKPNQISDPQPFRVYKISKPIDGIVTINAAHLSYDLSGYPIGRFNVTTLSNALSHFNLECPIVNYFNFSTDMSKYGEFTVDNPTSIRSCLANREGSIIDVYGGEWEFDKFECKLLSSRGKDRGVTIRYGKNMTSFNQEENCEETYTGLYPFYSSGDNYVELSGKIIRASGTYDYDKILALDLTSKFDSVPSQYELEYEAEKYMQDNNIDIPSVNLKVSYVQLDQSDEYADRKLLERVGLCDTVKVYFTKLGIMATAKCIKVKYNVLLDRVESIELGDAKRTIISTISGQSKEIKQLSARGGTSIPKITTLVLTLDKDLWSSGKQTVTATGASASNSITVGYTPDSKDSYNTFGITCISQAQNSLTFTCTTVPNVDIDVNVTIQE